MLCSRVLIYALFGFTLFSCSVSQDLLIEVDRTGEGVLKISIDPVVPRYIESLTDALGVTDAVDQNLFDLEAIRFGAAEREGFEIVSVEQAENDAIFVEFTVSDIVAAVGDAISFTSTKSDSTVSTTIDFELNRSSFLLLSRLFIAKDSPAALFIPVVERDFLPRSEYRELVTYAFGDFLDTRSVDTLLESAVVEIRVATDGTIVDIVGGIIAENVGIFVLPVLDLVTLEESVSLSLTWR